MPYVIPSMPLQCNYWHNWIAVMPTYAIPDGTCQCNLSPGKRTFHTFYQRQAPIDGKQLFLFPMEMLVPALEDIRMGDPNKTPDLVECPANTGRLYHVVYVDDIGKGFANEHRFVIMALLNAAVVFTDVTINCPPYPIP